MMPRRRFKNFQKQWIESDLQKLEESGSLKLFRGKVISKKNIAEFPGNFPIYSSSVKSNGLMGSYGKFMFNEELISWSVDGGGDFFYRDKHKFSLTNVSGYMRLDESFLSYRFVAYQLQLHHSKLKFDYTSKAHPSVIKKLYTLAIPSLEEQQKIASCLTIWDRSIKITEKQIENSKQQKKALMQQLLTGKKRLVNSETDKVFDGEWKDISLNDIASIMTDYVANGSFQALRENVNVENSTGHAFYVRLVDLRAGLGHSSQKYVDKASYEFLRKSSLSGGELLMANIGANVGEVWKMPEVGLPATLAPNMLMTKFKKNIDSDYVYYFLASKFGQIRVAKVIAGSGHPKINKTELKQVKILLPILREQQKIASVLTAADKEIEALEAKLIHLKQEKKALMQQLLVA